jgi:hypothetical protein
MTGRSSPSVAMVASPSRPEIGRHDADESSLTRSARSLADAARAFRQASRAQHAGDDLSRAFALVDAALDDLADGAELVAYTTMESSRRRRAGATDGLPLARARALSWRLHGLRSGLVAARRICSELIRVLDGAVGR